MPEGHRCAVKHRRCRSFAFNLQNQANASSWGSGFDATTVSWRDLYPAGSPEYNKFGPEFAIAQSFKNEPLVKAQAALPGSALAGIIYFDPKFVRKRSVGFDAPLLMHETMHNLGAIDSPLLTALGYNESDASDFVTRRLAGDCFGVTGNEVAIPPK